MLVLNKSHVIVSGCYVCFGVSYLFVGYFISNGMQFVCQNLFTLCYVKLTSNLIASTLNYWRDSSQPNNFI